MIEGNECHIMLCCKMLDKIITLDMITTHQRIRKARCKEKYIQLREVFRLLIHDEIRCMNEISDFHKNKLILLFGKPKHTGRRLLR